jgi:HAD superfamily hydrolase (TIGR01509 family)
VKSAISKIEAVIFDMDGLLLDSERISLSTFVAACREHDIEPDVSVYYRCIGTTFPHTREILREGYGKEFPLDSIAEVWRRKYQVETTTKPVPLKTGAVEILEYLHAQKIPEAVVTSSRWQNAATKLTNAGIVDYFQFIIGGDQITRGKPDPEVYLAACRKLNLEPAHCLALEDSDNGVRSACSAGLIVIQVPDMLTPGDEVLKLDHTTLKSLVEARDLIQSWFDRCGIVKRQHG